MRDKVIPFKAKEIKCELEKCSVCNRGSLELRTFTVKGEFTLICTLCIDRTPLTAKEKWTLNQNELNTKKAIEGTSERVGTDGEND